jgi:hypothetical protein
LLDVLPPQQEALVTQGAQIRGGHVFFEVVPIVGEDELVLIVENQVLALAAFAFSVEFDVLAPDQHEVTGAVITLVRGWDTGLWVELGFAPDLLPLTAHGQLVNCVRHEVEVSVGIVGGRFNPIRAFIVGHGHAVIVVILGLRLAGHIARIATLGRCTTRGHLH